MKLYEARNNTYQVSCGYCRHEGHNKRHCPTLRKHWEANKDWDGLSTLDLKDIYGSDFAGYWQVTDSEARLQYRYHFDYINKLMTSAPTTPKKRRASKCGFCGSTGHTRRNCSLMGEFVKVLEETNKAYRESFYENVFVKYGLGIGAFVQFRQYVWNPSSGVSGADSTSLIMDIDFDSISIGNRFSHWSDWHTSPQVKYRFDDKEKNFGSDLFLESAFPLLDKDGMGHLTAHYDGITKVVVPAPSLPDKEWFLGQSPAFDWVVKKKSLRDLFTTYGSIINYYHPDGNWAYNEWKRKVFS
jgi:hypothetical protein